MQLSDCRAVLSALLPAEGDGQQFLIRTITQVAPAQCLRGESPVESAKANQEGEGLGLRGLNLWFLSLKADRYPAG